MTNFDKLMPVNVLVVCLSADRLKPVMPFSTGLTGFNITLLFLLLLGLLNVGSSGVEEASL